MSSPTPTVPTPVLLGAASANGVPAELFVSGEARWLGIQAGQQPEHERILLVSVPYALKAGDAETLGGLPASAFVTTATAGNAANSAGGAATSSSTALTPAHAQSSATKATSTPQPAAACTGVTSDGSATVNSIALFTTPCNIQSSVITQASGNVGIGTAAPAVAVDVLGNNAGLRLNGTGTHQVTVTSTTTGVSGRLGQDANGFFFTSDTNGKSVRFLTNNGTLNEWMRITSAGNVGIGTQTPAAKLDINGNLNLPTTTSATVGVISLGGTPFAHNFGPASASNTFLGLGAGNFTMTGTSNTASGAAALEFNTTGVSNTASGFNALQRNTSGSSNTANGVTALQSNNTGNNNTATGAGALQFNASGHDNTASGVEALFNNTIGAINTASGVLALSSNTTGSGNTALGAGSGLTSNNANANTTGSNNTFIGANAGPGVASTTPVNNATAIGANALVSESNALVLGDGTVKVGIGTSAPTGFLHVAQPGSATLLDALTVTGGTSSSGNGGGITVTAGNSGTDFKGNGAQGGTVILTAGTGGAGGHLAGPGGFVALIGGNGAVNNGAPGGAGGNILLTPGSGGSGAPAGAAGSVIVAGNLMVTGSVSKGSGSFKIDHPLDPANKYLYHSFVESPDMMNIYNGVIVLDGHGRAWVVLPDWFEALNSNFRYQLTSMGSPQPRLYVAKEVMGNRFQIAGGRPHCKVSWQVTGIRHDAYANAHRIPVEEQKTGEDAGKYLYPELFGKPESLRVGVAQPAHRVSDESTAPVSVIPR